MEKKVLATVNGREVTEEVLQATITRFPAERQAYLATEEGKKQLLEQIVNFELMNDYGLELGYDKDATYLMQVEMAKKEILAQFTIGTVLNAVTVTETEIKEYFESNRETFKSEESVSAKHILVDSEEAALNIKKEIEAGLSFEEAAMEKSNCPSKAQGGNLGSFTRGRMVPEFEQVAFSLEVGVVSEPVKTQFGYHLIKVEEKNEGKYKEFEEVKDTIKNQLLQNKQNEKYTEVMAELRNKYNVTVNM